MAMSVKQFLDAARAAVPAITPAQAREIMKDGRAIIVDVRDAPEIEQSGKIAGAIHVSRGMLEFRADPESPYHDDKFDKDKTLILYCASGGARRWAARCSRIWAIRGSTISAPSRAGSRAAGQSRACA